MGAGDLSRSHGPLGRTRGRCLAWNPVGWGEIKQCFRAIKSRNHFFAGLTLDVDHLESLLNCKLGKN